MSRQSLRIKNKDLSSSEDSLPEQWASVQKRLDYVESTLVKFQRRNQKLQKKVQEQSDFIIAFKREAKKMIDEAMSDKKSQLANKQKQLQFENMKAQLGDLHSLIKRIEKKNNQMIKEIKNSAHGVLSDSMIDDQIEEKIQKMLRKHQNETDRSINQLRKMIKEQMRDPSPLDKKLNQNILSNSRSKVSIQKSANKSARGSYTDLAVHNDISVDKPKCKSPQQVNNGSSRVNYLRQKLKQFQETNKKFEEKHDRREGKQQKKTVQKMKDFKNYLEQSESQLDQSNLQPVPPHNVLTDSIQNWKNGQRYRYQ